MVIPIIITNYEQWKKEYRKLRKEKESFRNYFDKHKTCKCKIASCKHLKATEKELEFKHKSWELHIQYMDMCRRKLMKNSPKWVGKKKEMKK